jgi:hypothetical protein
MKAPFLNWLENCAMRFLISSPNVSLLVLKQHGQKAIYVARDYSDPAVAAEFGTPIGEPEPEPITMQLERMYHEPAYGELE